MHIPKDINVGDDLIKIKLLWRGWLSKVTFSLISHHCTVLLSVIMDSAITEVTLFIAWLLFGSTAKRNNVGGRGG